MGKARRSYYSEEADVFKPGGGGGTLRISGCGCAARTLEPLAYTRASFSWILLPHTRVNSWFPWPILDPNALIYIPYARVNCLKTIPFTAAHTYMAHIWQYPPPPGV